MRRIVPIALCAMFCLCFALPAFSQGDCRNENNDWQAIQDQRDAHRKAELIETFIKNCSNSPQRPGVDKTLVTFWMDNKDYQKIINFADSFKQSLPSADPASKAIIYTQAMTAAASANNLKKTVEFGDLALTAEPNNFGVLSFLAFSGILEPNKTLDYATKAAALPKPATMGEPQYQLMLGRMEGLLGLSLVSQNKFKEAIPHYEKALKLNPKDHANQFRYGFANLNLMGEAAQAATAANDELVKAMIATPTVQADVDKARAKVEAQSKIALDLRDTAMDSLAKAYGIGGQFAAQAKQFLDSLYLNKNKVADGEEQYIADKKKEIGL